MADGRLFEFSGADGATISGWSALRSRDEMGYDFGIYDGSQRALEARWHRKNLADLI